MASTPYPLAQLVPSLSRVNTVGAMPSWKNWSFGALATLGITGILGANLVSFMQGAVFSPAPYLVAATAARSRKNYNTYKAISILAMTLLMPGTSLIAAPGLLLGLLWMYPKLEKHLKFQDKKSRGQAKRRR